MAGFSPRFCTIHLKIHVCPDTGVTTKLKAQEDAISYKIRRLHGQQTEDDKALEQEKINRGMKEGTISALLAKAKATNAKQREETGINDDDLEHGPLVSEENISDRMARLRSKALGDSAPESTKSAAPASTSKVDDEPVTMAVRKTPKVTSEAMNDTAKPNTGSKEEKQNLESKDEYYDEDDNDDIHSPIYSTAEVSQMITDAVELALSKYIKATSVKSVGKRTVTKPATTTAAKKNIATKPTKATSKQGTKKTVTKKPTTATSKQGTKSAAAKPAAKKATPKKTTNTKKK